MGYGVGEKGYRCFDPVSQKSYVSRHVVFLEHIHFFSVPASYHNMAQNDFIRIDPFDIDTDEVVHTDTLVPETQTPPTPPAMTAQPSPEIADQPHLRQSTRPRKSTKLLDFAYSSYSTSFVFFLVSLHSLSEPLSYREVVVDPLSQTTIAEELTVGDDSPI